MQAAHGAGMLESCLHPPLPAHQRVKNRPPCAFLQPLAPLLPPASDIMCTFPSDKQSLNVTKGHDAVTLLAEGSTRGPGWGQGFLAPHLPPAASLAPQGCSDGPQSKLARTPLNEKGGFARKLEQTLVGAFALPGCSSQNFPARYLCLFSPCCRGCWGRFIFGREKAAGFSGICLPQAPAHFGPGTDEGELNVHGPDWAVTSIGLGQV